MLKESMKATVWRERLKVRAADKTAKQACMLFAFAILSVEKEAEKKGIWSMWTAPAP